MLFKFPPTPHPEEKQHFQTPQQTMTEQKNRSKVRGKARNKKPEMEVVGYRPRRNIIDVE